MKWDAWKKYRTSLATVRSLSTRRSWMNFCSACVTFSYKQEKGTINKVLVNVAQMQKIINNYLVSGMFPTLQCLFPVDEMIIDTLWLLTHSFQISTHTLKPLRRTWDTWRLITPNDLALLHPFFIFSRCRFNHSCACTNITSNLSTGLTLRGQFSFTNSTTLS